MIAENCSLIFFLQHPLSCFTRKKPLKTKLGYQYSVVHLNAKREFQYRYYKVQEQLSMCGQTLLVVPDELM